jgi:hypothetical protein
LLTFCYSVFLKVTRCLQEWQIFVYTWNLKISDFLRAIDHPPNSCSYCINCFHFILQHWNTHSFGVYLHEKWFGFHKIIKLWQCEIVSQASGVYVKRWNTNLLKGVSLYLSQHSSLNQFYILITVSGQCLAGVIASDGVTCSWNLMGKAGKINSSLIYSFISTKYQQWKGYLSVWVSQFSYLKNEVAVAISITFSQFRVQSLNWSMRSIYDFTTHIISHIFTFNIKLS